MNIASDGVFNSLRKKLDILGYTQSLPLAGIPLVSTLFEDLVKTTESLRDAKKQIVSLLEEKSCWELGVEPYKCDNARLLAECNQLHQRALQQHDEFEQRLFELSERIRDLQTDKQHLEEHCQKLEDQLSVAITKSSSTKSNVMHSAKQVKKPFISTVRSGEILPSDLGLSTINQNMARCGKCQVGNYQRAIGGEENHHGLSKTELQNLDKKLCELNNKLEFYKKKVETRDREIQRLTELLSNGRPPAVLAKNCCYKDLKVLHEDIDVLTREKSEYLQKIHEYKEQMHEAMNRALKLDVKCKQVQKELQEFKNAALQMEKEANTAIEERDIQIDCLKSKLELLHDEFEELKMARTHQFDNANENMHDHGLDTSNICKTKERLNEILKSESELRLKNFRLEKKVRKLKEKLLLQNELNSEPKLVHDENVNATNIRLQAERDFFQKEYLRMLNRGESCKELEFLHSQIQLKDMELKQLRSELCERNHCKENCTQPAAPGSACPTERECTDRMSNDCMQAAFMRTEREKNCIKTELERIRCERDMLREKNLHTTQMQSEEFQRYQNRIDELQCRLRELEKENRDLTSARLPTDTQIVLLKEEIFQVKRDLFAQQQENVQLRSTYNQLKILHEQSERSLADLQNKLSLAESQMQKTDSRLQMLDMDRESTQNETMQLRSELMALKQTYVALENERDGILNQLDAKTERTQQLEAELKSCKDNCNVLRKQVKELEESLHRLNSRSREADDELKETSAESYALKQQICALKVSREEAIAENSRLTRELADNQAEVCCLKKKLKESNAEIDRLKQQLHQYVQEVKKAEDLLMHKEKERDEMLEHYRTLSHDAVLLEGNNQSLEVEAAEYKRQITELECEIEELKKQLCSRNTTITQLEDKITMLNTRISTLEHEYDEAMDDQRLLKVDLAARKELCDKLDIQKEKLNAEMIELDGIRQKLERENERLRNEMGKCGTSSRTSEDTLTELLSKTRRDLEEQLKTDTKLSQELIRLRQRNEQLLQDLDVERQRRLQQETLAKEYQVQNQELRHNLTDDRFRMARTREKSPRFPTQTL